MAKKGTNFGLPAILKLYNVRLFLNGALWPFFISLILISVFIIKDGVKAELIEELVGLILSIIPNLLGFVLSGYALLIGFGNIEIIAKTKNLSDPSVYQKVSTVFAIGLIMQITLLVFAFTVKILLQAKLKCLFGYYMLCNVINCFIFFLLIFGLLYVVVMIKDLVINIFNVSQIQHFAINRNSNNNNSNSNGNGNSNGNSGVLQ